MWRSKVDSGWYEIAVTLWPREAPWVFKLSQYDFILFHQVKYAHQHSK